MSDGSTAAPTELAVGDPADYVVLLLDFMGQKEQLRRWKRLADQGSLDGQNHWPPSDPEGLADAVQKSAGMVVGFYRETRDHLINELFYSELKTPPDFQLKSIQFSDTVVFYGRMEERRQVGTQGLFLIYTAMMAAVSVMFNSMERNTAVRGAITIGQAIEGTTDAAGLAEIARTEKRDNTKISESFFYGPVLERANYLESHAADYPRILVDMSVVNYLNELQLASPNCPEFDANYRDFLSRSAGLVAGGVDSDESLCLDGFRVLDWAGQNFLGWAKPDVGKLFANKLPDFLRFANEAQANAMQLHAKTGGQEHLRVAGKYARLANYLEIRLPIWIGRQPPSDPGK